MNLGRMPSDPVYDLKILTLYTNDLDPVHDLKIRVGTWKDFHTNTVCENGSWTH